MMTTTERELVEQYRENVGRPSYLHTKASSDWGDDDLTFCVYGTIAQMVCLAVAIYLAVDGHFIALPIGLGFLTITVVIVWIAKNRRQAQELRQCYLGWVDEKAFRYGSKANKYRPRHVGFMGCPDFHKLYHQVGSRDVRPMRQQLAELCAQATIRYLQLPARYKFSDAEWAEVEDWLQEQYDEANRLSSAIALYDNEVNRVATDEKERADNVEIQHVTERIRNERKTREMLVEQDVDPVKEAVDALRENAGKVRQLNDRVNEEFEASLMR